MKNLMCKLLITTIILLHVPLHAQQDPAVGKSLERLRSLAPGMGLSIEDISDVAVSDLYRSEHNGITHVYLIQRYREIPVYNAITSFHVAPDGKVFDSPSRFYSSLADKVNATRPRISEAQALTRIVEDLQIPNALVPTNLVRNDHGGREFPATNFTMSPIPVKLVYMPVDEGRSLHLAWDLTLELSMREDYWSIRVDATTGEILDRHNLTVKCSFGHVHNQEKISSASGEREHTCSGVAAISMRESALEIPAAASPSSTGSYRVIAVPDESPKHGSHQLVVKPGYSNASPFGWHDTNGVDGAEHQITRGNNVHAYLDRNADNVADGLEPSGGSDLLFDFPYDANVEPDVYKEAAQVNLFYMNNMMHDISYQYGFNEAAGNFQSNNYGKGGRDADYVRAEAQDGSGTSNANFATPADGTGGRMQMFLWLASQEETYIVGPDSLAASIDCRRGAFGAAPTDVPIRAQVAVANDYSANPSLGCKEGYKRSEVEGKILLIERGTCEFGLKSLNAQKAGAVAVIICNFDDTYVNMGAGAVGGQVTIPAYFTTKSICTRLKLIVQTDTLVMEIRRPGANAGPDSLDGDFDNGIIAHEYGHGISNRLTGGPSSSGCLGNGEQMGEGWSDFMTLITSAKAGDFGAMPRGIGTFALNERPDGLGIRRRPYTTDMSFNEFTYKDMTAEVHDLGEIWTTVIWDLYWALADEYGYDPDFTNKAAGNNIAIQLVFDGMKLQPCSPGMIDGRNAILKADTINNKGANACLIWNVFARRGMGYFAKQGSNNQVGDETLSFIAAPICVDRILFSKRAGYYKDPATFVKNDVVKPGDAFRITLEIDNYRPGAANDVVIRDRIPQGCSYVSGSGSIAPQVIGDELVWNLGQMKSLESRRIEYSLQSSIANASSTLWYDDCESGEGIWEVDILKGDRLWYHDEGFGVDDSYSWIAEEGENGSDDFFFYNRDPLPLPDDNPALLFQHFFNTETGFDGGVVEASTDGFVWKQLTDDKFSLNGYTGPIDYQAFVVPNLLAFSGQSGGFIPSVIDLSDYKGKSIYLRFRFGNDSLNLSSDQTTILGWVVDNIELILPRFYNSEACLATAEGIAECASLDRKGVLADSDKIVDTQDGENSSGALMVYPNPGAKQVYVRIDDDAAYDELSLMQTNGQVLQRIPLGGGNPLYRIDTENLPRGMLILRAQGPNGTAVRKLFMR